MKKTLRVVLSIVLVFVLAFSSMLPAAAAGRVVYYLSDLKMAEAGKAEDAKKLLEEAGYEIYDVNLNPDGDKAVYLGYKTSTNVEDAITDVSVMNMNGGFNITEYDLIVEDALSEYKQEVDDLRIAAAEFAENYKKGTREALLAYRQMNYYYVEQPVLDEDGKAVLDQEGNEKTTTTYMGDYMLSFPESNDKFADILLKGNVQILANLRNLLAMGVSDGGALIDRINTAVADEAVYSKLEYYDYAKELSDKILQMKKTLASTEAEIAEILADEEMSDEDKELALIFPRYNYTMLLSFDEILKSIAYGESNYSELFASEQEPDLSVLYPLVEAMTPGQRAMACNGQLNAVLVYSVIEKDDAELEAELTAIEEETEPLSVYLGTDMSLIDGAVGVTSDALAYESSTGNKWFACFTGIEGIDITISTVFGLGGATLVGVSSYFLKQQYDISNTVPGNLDEHTIWFEQNEINVLKHRLKYNEIDQSTYDYYAQPHIEKLNEINAKFNVSTTKVVLSSVGLVVGLAMIAFSAYSIYRIVDSYNIEYTKIPSNMVNSVTRNDATRFVRYQVVNSLYTKGDEVKEKPGDTNGYEGTQWNAIYYTKNYEAGKCMTAVADWPATAGDFGTYTPVHKFGSNVCYDLNSYNNNDSTEKLFVAFSNSNNKKSAETAAPSVVGSTVSYGLMGISGAVGLVLGMLIMNFIKPKTKKEEEGK